MPRERSNRMIKQQGSLLILALYIQPNAKEDKIVGEFNQHIKLQITQPATDNKANLHLQKWLALQFKVPRRHVTLEKGHLSRYKQVSIQAPQFYPQWFKQLVEANKVGNARWLL